jgi:hypothetical protein
MKNENWKMQIERALSGPSFSNLKFPIFIFQWAGTTRVRPEASQPRGTQAIDEEEDL